jgi:hypothetical protein
MDRRAARTSAILNVRRPGRPEVPRTSARAAIPPDDVSPYIPDGFAPDTDEKRGWLDGGDNDANMADQNPGANLAGGTEDDDED